MLTDKTMKCEKCRWWDILEPRSDGGYCRRSAPFAQLVDDCTALSPAVVWPITTNYDWCGEFTKKSKSLGDK